MNLRLSSGWIRNPKLFVMGGMVELSDPEVVIRVTMETSSPLNTTSPLCCRHPRKVGMPRGPDRTGACVRDEKVDVGEWPTSPRRLTGATADSEKEIRRKRPRRRSKETAQEQGQETPEVRHPGRDWSPALREEDLSWRAVKRNCSQVHAGRRLCTRNDHPIP